MPKSTRPHRKREFLATFKNVVAERNESGVEFSLADAIDEVGRRMGAGLVVELISDEPQVPGPFPAPDGFHYPELPPRRLSARRRDSLLVKLQAKRPETRRTTVELLGAALDDPLVLDAIRTASDADPDPWVRGRCLVCLGLAATDPVESLVAKARRLVGEASMLPYGNWLWDLAQEGAADGVLGALVAAVGAGRADMAADVRPLAEALDRRPASDQTDRSARKRLALLAALDAARFA